jgi:DNA-binding LacI/PurR family transcriptional regulator
MAETRPELPARPRLEDVAAAVGLSTASVSLVLRGADGPSAATRARVLEAAARLGYRPDRAASLLARRRSRLIGVMMDVRSSYHGELVEAVHEAAERHGYDLVLSTVTRNRDEQRAVETLVDSRCEALVLLGPDASAAWLTALDRQLPVVVVGRPVPSAGVDVVRASDDEGVGAAVDHLVGLGHRDIAYVDGGAGVIATGRRRGYRTAMRRAGLADAARVVHGGLTEDDGARAAAELLGSGPAPTAVAAFNDRCAAGLLHVLRAAGRRIPEELSLVGFDDDRLAALPHVDLSTVRQDAPGLAGHAVARAVARLAGEAADGSETVVPPRLVVRGSTAPPP